MLRYLFLLITIKTCIYLTHSWESSCPEGCVCQTTHWIDTSVSRFLKQPKFELEPQVSSGRRIHNEILDNNLEHHEDPGPLVKIATCILQPETDFFEYLSHLCKDLEVLILLQSRGSGSLKLEPEHVSKLKKLRVLEARGSSPNEPLIIRGDTLSQLKNLEFLILEGASLIGHPSLGNRAAPGGVASFIELANIASNELQPLLGESSKLEFVTPSDNDENLERIPYKEYQREQQLAGLSAFSGLSSLRLLVMENCGIKDLTWDMLNGLSNLEHLSLAQNELLYIPELAFYATPKLRTLSLANNQILNVQSTSLVGLLDLERLDLSGNNISHLSELSLPPFPRLKHADLMNNPLEAVFASTFEVMNSTQSLALGSESSPLHLDPDAFQGLSELRTLRIERLEVPQLTREMFRGMSKLQELRITGVIPEILFDAFLEVNKLIVLLLRKCQITYLSLDAFYGLNQLERLDLSNNKIENLPPGIFNELISLRELELQNNRLIELELGLISKLPAKMIRLDGNPWKCSCTMSDWKPLTMVRTRISSILSYQMNINCNPHLDKGSECQNNQMANNRYRYDRRVAPLCQTPEKYRGWTIFQAIRKGLRCDHRAIAKDLFKSAYNKAQKTNYIYPEKASLNAKKLFYKSYEEPIKLKNLSFKNPQILNTINRTIIKNEVTTSAVNINDLQMNVINKTIKSENSLYLKNAHDITSPHFFQNKINIKIAPPFKSNMDLVYDNNQINNRIVITKNKNSKKLETYLNNPERNINLKRHNNENIDVFDEIRKIMRNETRPVEIEKNKKLKKALYLEKLKQEREKSKKKH